MIDFAKKGTITEAFMRVYPNKKKLKKIGSVAHTYNPIEHRDS